MTIARHGSLAKRFGVGLLGTALVLASSFAPAQAEVSIASAPLFLSSSVNPNVMFVLDDSGSMQWETMPDELTNIFSAVCCTNYMMWTFPRTAGLHGGGDYDGTRVPSFNSAHIMARAYRSSMVNSVYYDPAVRYRPWANADGTEMAAAPPAAAPNRPLFPALGTRNLTADNTQSARWVDTRTNAHTAESRTFYPAVYSTYVGPAIVNVQAAISDAASPLWNIANYTWTEIRSTTPTYTGSEDRTDCAAAPVCTYDEEIQNFANWYTYHRNRIFTSRGGIGRAFVDFGSEMRVGFGAINTHNFTVDSVSGSAVRSGVRAFEGTAKTSFYGDLYNLSIPPQGTPLRRALDGAGQYFSRSDVRGPWSNTPGVATAGENAGDHLACRQSFSILMTDGYTSGEDGNAAYGLARRDNTDGTVLQNTTNFHPDDPAKNYTYSPSDPFRDARGNTLADVSMYYWKRDLRSDIANQVPTSERNPAFWQHMVTYGVGLGVGGSIDPEDAWAALDAGTAIAWPDPSFATPNCTASTGECAARVDDLLHAAVNSRGGFFSASDPDTFSRELSAVLADIVARVETSGTAAATSSAVLQTDTLLYTASFRSTDWSGTVEAHEVNAVDGTKGTKKWDAEQKLNDADPANRKIFTQKPKPDGTKMTIELSWAQLDTAQQAALEINPSAVATTATGQDRIAWLRGVEHPGLRSRINGSIIRRIGDLVSSDPQFMYKRDFGYSLLPGAEGSSYKSFRSSTAYRERPDVLFVGSNDGMLHAFHAGTPYIGDPPAMNSSGGTELFAYMPSELLSASAGSPAPINSLAASDYTHRYYVDGTPTISDAYWGGSWKTVLVGTMGAGGRTVFALDVTDPEDFAKEKVLWEFTNPELGFGVTNPSIARLANGTWVAIFGNGYNSDGHTARLFVVRLSDGERLDDIDTGQGSVANPNGLAPPWVMDWPTLDLNAARAYAGDLLGNVWRFNLSGTPSVQTLFSATDSTGSPQPQPITAKPAVALMPGNPQGVVVTFGTGSYFRTADGDMASPQTQTLYGIFDTVAGESNVGRSDLLVQSITTNTSPVTIGPLTYPAGALRKVSSDLLATGDKGWVVDLPALGERVINEPTFPSGSLQQRVRFSTLIPDDDPCGSGRSGFLMDIDLLTGGRFGSSVFDLDDDSQFTASDDWGGDVVSGVSGLTGERVTIIRKADSDIDYLYAGDGDLIGEGKNTSGPAGRQSWHQLR